MVLTAPKSIDDMEFDSWQGCTSTDNLQCIIIVTADVTVTAVYITAQNNDDTVDGKSSG